MGAIWARWIFRGAALISLLWIAAIAFLVTPDVLVFAFKRGMLLMPAAVFAVSVGGWVVSSCYVRATSGN